MRIRRGFLSILMSETIINPGSGRSFTQSGRMHFCQLYTEASAAAMQRP